MDARWVRKDVLIIIVVKILIKEVDEMAYSDYGAFVWCNGDRRKDKEDTTISGIGYDEFDWSAEHTDWIDYIHHGIMGDDDILVICHKAGLPSVFEKIQDRYVYVEYDVNVTNAYHYSPIHFSYKGYGFCFKSGNPYYAKMVTPNGDVWECTYGFWHGAGFEDNADD